MANGDRGGGSFSRLWFVAALGGASCALASTEPAPLPRVPPAPEGTKRTVRYELEQTLEVDGGGDGHVLSTRGCTWIVFEERVARVVGDRETEIDIEVVDGNDPRCDEGRRFSLKGPFAEPAPDARRGWRYGWGPVELARILHARLGQATGAFSFGTRELPWNGAVGAARAGGVDYVTYAAHAVQADQDPTLGETTRDARMQLRRRDGKLACARATDRWRQTDAGAGAARSITLEAIMVDYGDGAPPRCEDATPASNAAPPSTPILSRAQELEAVAKKAAGGSMGCGVGTLTLITSRGRVRILTGLDPIHVLGNSVASADLLTLLRARIESNRSGQPGPMSGSVSRLVGLSLYLLSVAKEPEAVEVSAALLADPDPKIRASAAINLYELGDRRPRLRPEIRRLHLPTQAVQEAASDGHAPPGWLRE